MIRRLAVLAFFSVAAAGSASAQTVMLLDWHKWCKDGPPKECQLSAIARNDANEFLQMYTESIRDKPYFSMNVMRGSLAGSKTAVYNLDKGKPVKFNVNCEEGAPLCTLNIPLTAETMSAFKKASVFNISVPVSKLQFDVPLKSFAAAVDSEGVTRAQHDKLKADMLNKMRP